MFPTLPSLPIGAQAGAGGGGSFWELTSVASNVYHLLKRCSFFSFSYSSYVCPEPVLVASMFIFLDEKWHTDKKGPFSYQRSDASAEPFTCANRARELARRSVAADSNPAAPVRS